MNNRFYQRIYIHTKALKLGLLVGTFVGTIQVNSVAHARDKKISSKELSALQQIAPAAHKSAVEAEAQKIAKAFQDLNNNINIAGVSDSIVSSDAYALKKALEDVINLNRIINSQLDLVIKSWNQYLDTITTPNQETYLLGQVMSSFIMAMRSLSLRSSVDQAMILSLVKKNFGEESTQLAAKKSNPASVVATPNKPAAALSSYAKASVEQKQKTVEKNIVASKNLTNRWHSLRM